MAQNGTQTDLLSQIQDEAVKYALCARNWINGVCETHAIEPWLIIVLSMVALLSIQWLWEYLFEGEGGFAKTKKNFFRTVRKIPYVRNQIQAEIDKTAKSLQLGFAKDLKPGMSFLKQLPAHGSSAAEVCRMASDYKSMSIFQFSRGRASGTLYNGGAELTELNGEIYKMFAWTNPLHGDLFPDVRKMEAEVVQMCISMFNGSSNACGTVSMRIVLISNK